MEKVLLVKPTVKDIKKHQYVGGRYEVVEQSYIDKIDSRMSNYNIIKITKKDLKFLGREGYYSLQKDGQIFYFRGVDSYHPYVLEENLTENQQEKAEAENDDNKIIIEPQKLNFKTNILGFLKKLFCR